MEKNERKINTVNMGFFFIFFKTIISFIYYFHIMWKNYILILTG